MGKVRMIATGMTYGTRRLVAGDEIMVERGSVRAVKALGIATDIPVAEKPIRRMREPVQDDADVLELRDEYQVRTGRTADKRWGVQRLREAIASGQQRPRDPACIVVFEATPGDIIKVEP